MYLMLARAGVLAALALVPFFSLELTAQLPPTGTLRGRVIEAGADRGVVGAQVSVSETRLGAITGDNGRFVITGVPTGPRTLTIRRLGYQAATRAVNVTAGDVNVGDIALSVSAVNLSEVVVTGSAAPTERRKVGTSVASVDSTLIGRSQAVAVDQAMQGKIPGAQITQNSGGPGGGGISVRLRGTNSFISGSDPLYIVDGLFF